MPNHMEQLDISTGGDLSDVYRPHIARLRDPQGNVFFLTYSGLTERHGAATVFANRNVAARAANSFIHGDPHAFWESERKSAARARAQYRGWKADSILA